MGSEEPRYTTNPPGNTFQPRMRVKGGRLMAMVLLTTVLWIAGLLIVAAVYIRDDVILLSLKIFGMSLAVGLLWLGMVVFLRKRRDRKPMPPIGEDSR